MASSLNIAIKLNLTFLTIFWQVFAGLFKPTSQNIRAKMSKFQIHPIHSRGNLSCFVGQFKEKPAKVVGKL